MFSHGSSVINEFYSQSSPSLACGLWCIRFCCASTYLSSTRYDSAPTVRNIQRDRWLLKLSSSVSCRHESKMLILITSSTVLFWLPFEVCWLETVSSLAFNRHFVINLIFTLQWLTWRSITSFAGWTLYSLGRNLMKTCPHPTIPIAKIQKGADCTSGWLFH